LIEDSLLCDVRGSDQESLKHQVFRETENQILKPLRDLSTRKSSLPQKTTIPPKIANNDKENIHQKR
jgi:hypothetical protein